MSVLSQQGLKEYIPGKSIPEIAAQYGLDPSQIIKLGSNENPWGPSPKVQEGLKNYLSSPRDYRNDLALYPDALGERLLAALKKQFKEIGQAELIVGNGMDNVLEGLGRLLLAPGDKTVIHTPTFEYYEMVTRWAKAEPIFVKTKAEEDFKIDAQAICRAIEPGVKLVFLCSPNNPTGAILNWAEIEAVCLKAAEVEAQVFLDEAYIEFAPESQLGKVQEFDNLIVGRTFSKAYGIAALRVGWAAIPPKLLSPYRKVQTPFSVNSLGLVGALLALEDQAYVAEKVAQNAAQREFLSQELNSLGYKVFPSAANFIAFSAGQEAGELCRELLKHGLILRNASPFRDAPTDLVRVTIGRPEQNQKLLETLRKISKA